jgi:cytochrome c peroxidase
MHAGQLATLEEVLAHYSQGPAAPAGHSEIDPLNLTPREIEQLIAFLKTLDGPVNADPEWLRNPRR